ncbi:MAG: hypothetical protein WBK55_10355 [Alphaproteobacteria bacterium]
MARKTENVSQLREFIVYPETDKKLKTMVAAFEQAGLEIPKQRLNPRLIVVVATPEDIIAAGGERISYEDNNRPRAYTWG